MAAKAPPAPGTFGFRLVLLATRANTAIYRLSKGRLGGKQGKAVLCVLHHRGAKSGRVRETPLYYAADGDDVILVASYGGTPKHPAWYHNLRAHPDVEVERLGSRVPMRARVAKGEERERLWRLACERWPDYDKYQSITERQIPVVVCSPR